MTQERAHTELPWMTDNIDVFSGGTRGFKKVCHLTNDSRDGAFIVAAVNAYPLIEELTKALEKIRWKSIDKDNMEFAAKVSCYEMDALLDLLSRAREVKP